MNKLNRTAKAFKVGPRRSLPLEQRDIYGFNALDMIQLRAIVGSLEVLAKERKRLRRIGQLSARVKEKLRKRMKLLVAMATEVATANVPDEAEPKIKHARRTLKDFDAGTYSAKFRFRSADDLHKLMTLLQLPATVKVRSYRYTNEEIILISLMRLSYPARWLDVAHHFPGRGRAALQSAFYWFLDFMIQKWGYLLLNNREFWLPRMVESAEAIRVKLATLPTIAYRQQDHLPANQVGGFAVFGFIDNTMVAMCRPGGGPRTEGVQAPRHDPLLQRAWWTGWKKLHGMKWQTVTMANGMDFEVWGPASVRRNDLYTLSKSRILEKLAELQQDQALKFKLFGDSAYFDEEFLATNAGRGMASCRETIEWRYKDLKGTWKYLDYRHCLQLQKQPIAKIIFVCMLLSNAHCTMYGCEAAAYFDCPPPSLEEWLSQGPAARPIPNDIIFSAAHVVDNAPDEPDDDYAVIANEEDENGAELNN